MRYRVRLCFLYLSNRKRLLCVVGAQALSLKPTTPRVPEREQFPSDQDPAVKGRQSKFKLQSKCYRYMSRACENKDADQRRSNCEADHTFVFATRIVRFVYFLNPKFAVSSHLL